MNIDNLLQLYYKIVTDKLSPYLKEVHSKLLLQDKVDIHSPSFPEGSNSNNRLKYFDQRRPYIVCKVIQKFKDFLLSGKKSILDVGCGIGDFSAMFAALGHDVVGLNGGETWYLEDFRYCCDLLKITHLIGDVTKPLSFLDQRFEIVFSSECLTLGTLIDKQDVILEQLHRIGKKILVVNHDNRRLTYNKVPFEQINAIRV